MKVEIVKHSDVYREGALEDGCRVRISEDGSNIWTCTDLTFPELIQLRDALDEVIEEELSDPSDIERL